MTQANSEHDINIIKKQKSVFIDRLIFSGVSYQLCANISRVLNNAISGLENQTISNAVNEKTNMQSENK